MRLRVAAISFLNPAPLLWDFEHGPRAAALAERYDVRYTKPSECARQLLAGEADLGLIPIAALTPELAVVPGCTIASLGEVRSILLLVKNPAGLGRDEAMRAVRTVAADAASRSSQAYVHLLLEQWMGVRPEFVERDADPLAMLGSCDAALLIGDPALWARERRAEIDAECGPLLWLDVAEMWREWTGLPWVAAVWAVRPAALVEAGVRVAEVVGDLIASRDAGMAHVEELVREWAPRVRLSEAVVREYLTRNIHYVLDEGCLQTVERFRTMAAKAGVLPALGPLRLLA